MSMKKLTTLIMGLILLPALAVAATIHVPLDQPTIQAGINAAANGDMVLVAAGTYLGDGNRDLDYGGKLLVLKSESGPELTIIDCQADSSNRHNGFYFHSKEDSTAILDGFTIKHAYSYSLGAVSCDSAGPTIRNCIITENLRSGISLRYGYGLIVENCVISNNAMNGINLDYCSARISECSIDNNLARGIMAYNNATPTVTNCLISNNGSIGMSIWVFTTKFHITNCTFANNQVGFYYDGDFPKAQSAEYSGGADTSIVTNSIFAFNRDYGFQTGSFAGYFRANCNDWFGNPSGNFHFQATGSPFDTSGNISANPLFCGTPGNRYGIATQSPCAPSGNSCGVLMGRYQPSCTINFVCGDMNGDNDVDISDIVYLLQYIFTGGPAPVLLDAASVNCDGSIDIADIVYLIRYIFLGGDPPCADCP
jgi:parallel beta-helix repeat protein